MSEQILHTTDDDFQTDVLNSEQPVLIDFWAEWCSPCKRIAPIVDQLAGEFSDRLKVFKLDVEENPRTAKRYNVRSIPTLLLFRDGAVAAQHVGLASKAQLESFVTTNLPAAES